MLVIPVLVQGAKMPRRDYLPEPLQALADKNAHEMSDSRWDHDVDKLVTVLQEEAGLQPVARVVTSAAPCTLKADLPDFTGRRDQIEWLRRILEKPGGRAALDGLGGVGKTSLAVHVAHLVKSAYPDGQIQVDLKGLAIHF